MGVGKKLSLAFYTIIGLMAVSVMITLVNLSSIQSKSELALGNRIQQLQLAEQIYSDVHKQELFARAIVSNNNEASQQQLAESVKSAEEHIIALKPYAKYERVLESDK